MDVITGETADVITSDILKSIVPFLQGLYKIAGESGTTKPEQFHAAIIAGLTSYISCLIHNIPKQISERAATTIAKHIYEASETAKKATAAITNFRDRRLAALQAATELLEKVIRRELHGCPEDQVLPVIKDVITSLRLYTFTPDNNIRPTKGRGVIGGWCYEINNGEDDSLSGGGFWSSALGLGTALATHLLPYAMPMIKTGIGELWDYAADNWVSDETGYKMHKFADRLSTPGKQYAIDLMLAGLATAPTYLQEQWKNDSRVSEAEAKNAATLQSKTTELEDKLKAQQASLSDKKLQLEGELAKLNRLALADDEKLSQLEQSTWRTASKEAQIHELKNKLGQNGEYAIAHQRLEQQISDNTEALERVKERLKNVAADAKNQVTLIDPESLIKWTKTDEAAKAALLYPNEMYKQRQQEEARHKAMIIAQGPANFNYLMNNLRHVDDPMASFNLVSAGPASASTGALATVRVPASHKAKLYSMKPISGLKRVAVNLPAVSATKPSKRRR